MDLPAGFMMHLNETTDLDASGNSEDCTQHPPRTVNHNFIASPSHSTIPFISTSRQYVRSPSRHSYIRSKQKDLAAAILLRSHVPFHSSPFKFSNDLEAAHTNWNMLKKLNFTLPSSQNSITSPSFEFNSVKYLSIVLQDHPSWNATRSAIVHGISYPLRPINEAPRLSRLKAMIKRGNHPIRANQGRQELHNFIMKELAHGWILPVPIDIMHMIPEAEVCPIHLVTQDTIDDEGNAIVKYRPCHDLTFSPRDMNENLSVNHRHEKDVLPSIQYGRTFE